MEDKQPAHTTGRDTHCLCISGESSCCCRCCLCPLLLLPSQQHFYFLPSQPALTANEELRAVGVLACKSMGGVGRGRGGQVNAVMNLRHGHAVGAAPGTDVVLVLLAINLHTFKTWASASQHALAAATRQEASHPTSRPDGHAPALAMERMPGPLWRSLKFSSANFSP